MSKNKPDLSPAEIAALVRARMVASTGPMDLSEIIDLDRFEQMLVSEIREHRLKGVPNVMPASTTKN